MWVCRDDPYLYLSTDRLELTPGAGRKDSDITNTVNTALEQETEAVSKPVLHPLSMLPLLAHIMEGELEAAEVAYDPQLEAHERPYVLDDATIARAQRLCDSQLQMVHVYRAQLAHWRRATPSRKQREQLKRHEACIATFKTVVGDTRALVEDLASSATDNTKAKSARRP